VNGNYFPKRKTSSQRLFASDFRFSLLTFSARTKRQFHSYLLHHWSHSAGTVTRSLYRTEQFSNLPPSTMAAQSGTHLATQPRKVG
jgi:hypothetical protein